MITLPSYAFTTYYTRGNPYTVPQKGDVQEWIFHFKQKYGPSSVRFKIDFGDGIVAEGRTFEAAQAALYRLCQARQARIKKQLRRPADSLLATDLVPIPCSSSVVGSPSAGAGTRIAKVLAAAGAGTVVEGLRWTRPQQSASASSSGDRKPAPAKFEDLVWVAGTPHKRIVLVDDVVSYGDSTAAAAERIFRQTGIRPAGVITLGRTNGGVQPDAALERLGLVTYDPDGDPATWDAALDGVHAPR